MKNEQIRVPEEDSVPTENSKLIQLDSENTAKGNQARDINVKITSLEDSLGSLQSELEQINQSVETGLERLGSNDLDLTAKVSETYKRLGEIDNTYRSLSAISESIDTEVKKLTVEIGDVAAESANELENLKSSTTRKNTELNNQHQQLVERVNALVANSRDTHERLQQSITKNTDALLKLEKELVAEIDRLADTTQQRDEELADDIDTANREIEAGKARILKMQAVDEALGKRASELEQIAAELHEKTRVLDSSVELLDVKTHDLSISVDRLYALSNAHATLIGDLQRNASQLGAKLRALTGTEKLHFRLVSGGLVLLLLAITAVYFYQQSLMETDAQLTAERTVAVDQQLSNLNQDVAGLDQEVVVTNDVIGDVNRELQSKLEDLNRKVVQEVGVLNEKVQGMDDHVQSLDGRLDRVSPFSQLGRDGIIHGPHWLKQQPANLYAVEVAVVRDKDELYEVAQRYRHYLKDTLSYYTIADGRSEAYMLVLGNYASSNEAASVAYRMPRYINDQRPAVTRIGEIQDRM